MIQKPKGTYDVFGKNSKKIIYFENLFREVMSKYNYEYFRTPIFEASELFHRGVGETTDIVSKETFNFKDKSDRDMTLRPEGTAGIVRSFIENKYYSNPSMPVKIWYMGPMFRYERPQAGRYREFYQCGVEVFGSNDPLVDAEVISIPVNIYKLLGFNGIKVNINTLGDTESRLNYKKALLDYFKPHINDLCEDCKARYEKNPLRILDCKVDASKSIMDNAPKIKDNLTEESLQHFEMVCKYLDSMGIEYVIKENLVRGLDYYTHTVFEVEANIKKFGSQNVLCGGGRYNGLVSTLDGPDMPGVGFAIGIERTLLALDYENINLIDEDGLDIYISYMSENEKAFAMNLVNILRLSGFKTDLDLIGRNIKNNFKQAERLKAKYVIIIGEEEIKNNILTIKNNISYEEHKIKFDDLIEFFDTNISE
ncbi:MAG TPA: histidine--tRNA ligase [Tenericutes bacterium]|nr:histidine--tRNA ligase [Mycoplasmatota bacterium]